MASWERFEAESPDLARLAKERFSAFDLVMLGTIKKDGWPRITPIEYTFFDGELTLGGMWQSRKMLDLLRDPRCAIHSVTSDKGGKEGDVKLYGRCLPLAADRVEPYWQHIFELLNWRPDGPSHVFVFEVESAGYVQFDGAGGMRMKTWPGPEVWVDKPAP